MLGLTLGLLFLVAAGSGLDLRRKRHVGRQKKQGEEGQEREEEKREGGDGRRPANQGNGGGDSSGSSSDRQGRGGKGGAWLPLAQSALLCFSLPRNWALLLAKSRGGELARQQAKQARKGGQEGEGGEGAR